MNIVINTANLKPSTIAAMIADLLDAPVANANAIKQLIYQLEITVGEQESIEYLAEAGISPGRGAQEWQAA